ncbi:hypothetical protein IAD21_06383 [Abditibacteriota bacterium]|nr:hypothetical protein IAD21_06383 [Abditibacteriota bacterium]
MERELKNILATGAIPTDLEITYDDRQGLWGGLRIIIDGTGGGTREKWDRGATRPDLSTSELTSTQIKECIALLVELEAWAQKTPDRPPVPDEGRATLTLRVGGQSSHIWEWFNELTRNGRLLQIQKQMVELTTTSEIATDAQTPGDNKAQAQTLSRQARENLDMGNFEAAIPLYEQALSLDGERVNDWINRGLALWSVQRNEAALESYDHALALDPNNALAWMNRGNALHDLGRSQQEIMSCYDRALESDPYLARAWYNKGDELGHMGRFIEARACFENAYELGLTEAAPMINRCNDILMNDSYS